MEAVRLQMTSAAMRMESVLIPEYRAAPRLPPVASTALPKLVCLRRVCPRMIIRIVQMSRLEKGPRSPDPKKELKEPLRIGMVSEFVIDRASPLRTPAGPERRQYRGDSRLCRY